MRPRFTDGSELSRWPRLHSTSRFNTACPVHAWLSLVTFDIRKPKSLGDLQLAPNEATKRSSTAGPSEQVLVSENDRRALKVLRPRARDPLWAFGSLAVGITAGPLLEIGAAPQL